MVPFIQDLGREEAFNVEMSYEYIDNDSSSVALDEFEDEDLRISMLKRPVFKNTEKKFSIFSAVAANILCSCLLTKQDDVSVQRNRFL